MAALIIYVHGFYSLCGLSGKLVMRLCLMERSLIYVLFKLRLNVEFLLSVNRISRCNPSKPGVPIAKVWRPPRYLKINSIAAFNPANGKGFAGIVCMDERGTILITMHKRIFASSPLVAEAPSLAFVIILNLKPNSHGSM